MSEACQVGRHHWIALHRYAGAIGIAYLSARQILSLSQYTLRIAAVPILIACASVPGAKCEGDGAHCVQHVFWL